MAVVLWPYSGWCVFSCNKLYSWDTKIMCSHEIINCYNHIKVSYNLTSICMCSSYMCCKLITEHSSVATPWPWFRVGISEALVTHIPTCATHDNNQVGFPLTWVAPLAGCCMKKWNIGSHEAIKVSSSGNDYIGVGKDYDSQLYRLASLQVPSRTV